MGLQEILKAIDPYVRGWINDAMQWQTVMTLGTIVTPVYTNISRNSNGNISGINSGAYVVVGSIAGTNFVDLVIHQLYGNTIKISSVAYATPPGRTYSDSSGALNLALDNTGTAGSYAIQVTRIGP